jgi:hypothetical protein
MRLLLALVFLSACHKKQPSRLTEFAVKFVEDGRSIGIPPEAIDEGLINRVHRAQKVRIAGQGNAPPDILVKIWHDESESHGTPEERSARQRERARQAMSRTLEGSCRAEVDEGAATLRLGALTEPTPNTPDEVKNGLLQLRDDLKKAIAVRVTCNVGSIGLLAVPRDGSWRVVDLFQMGVGPKLNIDPSKQINADPTKHAP